MNGRYENRALATGPGLLALAVWIVYLLLALSNLPDLPHRVLISGFFGLLACVAVLLNYRHWRVAVLLASCVYLVTYAVLVTRMAMMVTDQGASLVSALSFYYSTSWQVSTGVFQERGFLGGLAHVFLEYLMPLLNIVLIALTLMSRRPKHSVLHAS
jgi:hypothetical protein